MAKKYEDMVNKVGNLEMKIRELEQRETMKKAEEVDCDKTVSEIHPVGSSWPAPQPEAKTCPVLHSLGRQQGSRQPTGHIAVPALQPDKEETNNHIYSVVRQARKTVGFGPITNRDIEEIMDDMKIENHKVGMEEVIKDFLRAEMAIPDELISELKFTRIFRRAGDLRPNDDKLYVEFVEESMSAKVYKYVRKMRSQCSILTFIPKVFRERADELEKAAYKLRHSTPSYNTKIRWGWGDLILERKLRGSREPYRSVHLSNLPPWT